MVIQKIKNYFYKLVLNPCVKQNWYDAREAGAKNQILFSIPKNQKMFSTSGSIPYFKIAQKTQISAYVITQTEMFLGRMSVGALL